MRHPQSHSPSHLRREQKEDICGDLQTACYQNVTRMDPKDLENVIRQALEDALAAGKDSMSQTELAVQAVQRARPDMTASDALAAVNLMRRS